ncbi:nuclear transport factor 2 family protein [Kitasatospora sp. NPDC088346]|uniref:nuclear transport factor 2 family protein n=1 Tax=Kitasatospora sp. NPDC088346 TaxID=3364073 RepID=UPI00381D2B1D
MSDSAEDISNSNAEVVRRYLRVFETKEVAALEELVAEDVLVHGAGLHGQGRHYPEGAVLTPGLSNRRVQVDDLFAAGDRVTVAFTLTYTHDRSGRDLTMTGIKSTGSETDGSSSSGARPTFTDFSARPDSYPSRFRPSDRTTTEPVARPGQLRDEANVAGHGTPDAAACPAEVRFSVQHHPPGTDHSRARRP